MGVVILGGLVTSTLVNVFVLPGIYLNFGSVRTDTEIDLTLFEEELTIPDQPAQVPTNDAAGATGRQPVPGSSPRRGGRA